MGTEPAPQPQDPRDWNILLEALQNWDRHAAPVGLYAAEEYRMTEKPQPRLVVEWNEVIAPTLRRMGCHVLRPARQHFLREGQFWVQQTSWLHVLSVVRVAKIKVRCYGNSYRVDPCVDFAARWREAELGTRLRGLRKRYPQGGYALLFLGFAKEQRPFRKELQELTGECSFARAFDTEVSRVWDDPHGRAFQTIAVIWHTRRQQD
ncbi:MAG: hypothetical protein H7A46_02580 [Verrucomicrobiales bacterium]|nr:hypothetical protein [Verrucomicrobiales bacterium]